MDAVNSSIDHLGVYLPWARSAVSEKEAESVARSYSAKFLANEAFTLAILPTDESAIWGNASFNLWECPLDWGNAEIGMWIRAGKAGKGLGTAVLKAMIDWGFTEWPWSRLSWKCDVANLPSRRTAERVGMKFEGIHRRYLPASAGKEKSDAMVYAILISDLTHEARARNESTKNLL